MMGEKKWRYYSTHRDEIRESNRRYRASHREQTNAYVRKAKAEYRVWLRGIMSGHQCAMCGSADDLLFHHRDGTTKLFNIGRECVSKARALAEMQKCDVLCRRCHPRVHADTRGESIQIREVAT